MSRILSQLVCRWLKWNEAYASNNRSSSRIYISKGHSIDGLEYRVVSYKNMKILVDQHAHGNAHLRGSGGFASISRAIFRP